MEFDKIGLGLMHMLAQAPDTKLWPSIRLMKPEERPKYPVRTIDPDPSKYPVFRHRKDIEGMFDRHGTQFGTNMPTILINKGGAGYTSNDPKKMAATMIHEGEHIRRNDEYEPAAYQKQLDFLNRIGHNDKNYITGIFNRSKIK